MSDMSLSRPSARGHRAALPQPDVASLWSKGTIPGRTGGADIGTVATNSGASLQDGRARTSKLRLQHLPTDLLNAIASSTRRHEALSLVPCLAADLSAVEPLPPQVAAVTAQAQAVSTLDDACLLLGETFAAEGVSHGLRSLQAEARGAPLVALGCRLTALPLQAQVPAIEGFRRAVAEVPAESRCPALVALHQAAGQGADDLRRAGQELALAAVEGGQPVALIAQRHALTAVADWHALELRAVDGSAGETVLRGESVDVVARRHGIASLAGREALEDKAVQGHAGHAVRAGGPVGLVARRHGIVTEPGLRGLEQKAIDNFAGADIRAGLPVLRVADDHQITTEWGLSALTDTCVQGPAGEAVRAGNSVSKVANWYQIKTAKGLDELQALATAVAHAKFN